MYYKRDDSKEWKGPGSVIGQDGKVVIIRHGSSVIRAHSSRVLEQKKNVEWDDGKSELLDFLRKYFGNQKSRNEDVELTPEKTLNVSPNAVEENNFPVVVNTF